MIHVPDHLKREAEIQREIVTWLRGLHLKVFITSEPRAKKSSRNIWDLYVVKPRNGRSGWFETKKPGEKPTVGQYDFQQHHVRSDVCFGWGQLEHAQLFAAALGATRMAA